MELSFRQATESDLLSLVRMLVDDELGKLREDLSEPVNPRYLQAFAEIRRDPNNELVVAESGQKLVGMLQISFIPYLTYRGAWRCLIEARLRRAEEREKGKPVKPVGRQEIEIEF